MTKDLFLNNGQEALVDSDIYEKIKMFSWKLDTHGYVYRNSGQKVYLHHFVLGEKENGKFADHINGNVLDNRRANLRWVTIGQSNCNRKSQGGTSRYKGVSFDAQKKRYRVQIWFNEKKTHGGYFSDEISAAMAYDVLARELHGKFARLNFPHIDASSCQLCLNWANV